MAVMLHKWFLVLGLWFSAPQAYENISDNTAAAYHPFYVSVTEISHNSQDKTLEISCKIFLDDMEGVLKQNYKTNVDLTDKKKEAEHNKFIASYISKHLAITADGRESKLNFIGFERDSESVWCYFEAANIPSVKKLDITNSILQDYTDKQINIMHITVNGSRKSYKLDYPHKQASFSF